LADRDLNVTTGQTESVKICFGWQLWHPIVCIWQPPLYDHGTTENAGMDNDGQSVM